MNGEFPLVVGASLKPEGGEEAPTLVALTRNFVPASVQRAEKGHLYTMETSGADTYYLLPQLPAGEQESDVYFQGQLEEANPEGGAGADTECVAVFDEASGQWTLEAVTYKIATRFHRGLAPGYQAIVGATPAAEQQHAPAAARQPLAPMPSGAFDNELDAALFGGGEEEGEEEQEEEEDMEDMEAAAAAEERMQQQQQEQQQPGSQQQQQPHPGNQHHHQPQQQHHHHHHNQQRPASPEAAHAEDDVWDDVLPPLPAAAPTAAAAASRGVVVEDEGAADGDVHHCSEDDSDGIGVEVV